MKTLVKKKPDICRVTRPREEAKSVYDRMSRWYDLIAGSSEQKLSAVGLEMLNIQEGEKILEIGFGTGYNMLQLANAVGTSGKVFGIDISEGMHKMTRTRMQRAGLLNRVILILGDAMAYPFETNFFNAIFISFTLELFDTPDIPVFLQNCKKILHPDGRICVVSLSKKNNPMVKLYELVHNLFPKYLDCRPIYVQQSMIDAGFTITEVKELSMWGLPVDVVLANKR